ncbi:virulence associated lipoprotein [Borrelia duttonii]|uniref:Uncharacterized conserved protein n=1 Tax=Borrelia duttonii (strain Ly) TaxID=412419 RepID=B5RN76_BORDL|nr:uncharacterized conserved protein [Borrelia duttonii Ly]
MKRKDFILFIMFVFILILLLLVSCGPKKYTPVSSAVRRGPNGVTGGTNTNGVTGGSQVGAVNGGLNGGTGTGDNEQILKQKEIESIKIPDKVLKILETHDDENWDEDAAGYNLTGANQLFTRVKYEVVSGKFLYNDATDDKRAKVSKTARREFYLACEYNANFIKAFAGVVNKLVATDELAAKNNAELEQFFLEDVRSYARFYYNAYLFLKAKQSKLDSLTLEQLQLLKAKFLELEKEQQELFEVIQLIINDYNNDTSINLLEPTHHLKSDDTLPSEIIEYWKKDTRHGDFNKKRGRVIHTAIMIENLLKDI